MFSIAIASGMSDFFAIFVILLFIFSDLLFSEMTCWSSIPQDIIYDLLFDWILVQEVGKLNTACCNYSQRNALLHTLEIKSVQVYCEELKSFFNEVIFRSEFRNSKVVKFVVKILDHSQENVFELFAKSNQLDSLSNLSRVLQSQTSLGPSRVSLIF